MEQTVQNNLKKLRFENHLTQEDLAQKVGVSRQTINAIEGDKYLPTLTLAFKIARVFKVNIEDIFIYK